MKVFLAEDDLSTVALLKILLEMEGHEAIPYDHKRAVLEEIDACRPDVIVLDLNLSNGVKGMDVLKALRSHPDEQLRKTPVVVCSGESRGEEVLQAGANAFLLKPYMPDDLLKAIRDVA
jgi:DNA-binding response OmpR family regulator